MTNMKLAGILPALILSAIAIMTASAEARTRHTQEIHVEQFDRHNPTGAIAIQAYAMPAASISRSPTASRRKHDRRYRDVPAPVGNHFAAGGQVQAQVVAHPSGCPASRFCGCGASVDVYGHPVRELYLASAWFKFPRTSPAPGMVAVRSHHVFVIREVLGGNMVLAYDANSGGRQTRIHPRSLAGYTVVNPRGGSRYARAD